MTGPAPIKVLSNATDLIEVLAWDGPQSPADIAARIGVPRSSVYRLIEGLVAISMIESTDDSKVRLTSRWLHLADAARAAMVEWGDAHRVLDSLVEETGQTAFLTLRRDDRAVCIDWRQGRGIGVLVLRPGRSLPLYAGAAGRVLLAFGDSGSVLDSAPHRALTPHTLTTREQLEADIARTLAQGYTFSDEDVTIGVSAIGMPVLDREGLLVGGVSVGGPSTEIRAAQATVLAALERARDALVESRT